MDLPKSLHNISYRTLNWWNPNAEGDDTEVMVKGYHATMNGGSAGGLTARRLFSVSMLTTKLKNILEEEFPFVWIYGEISNIRIPGSGHCYFTLKDNHSQIAAVMFRSQFNRLPFRPDDGMEIIGLGRVSVYEPRGTYQIIFEKLDPFRRRCPADGIRPAERASFG
jgi:hypothetical protein